MADTRRREASGATAAAASATSVGETVEDTQDPVDCEEGDQSDDENMLHGPCNIKPAGADENPRLVSKCLLVDVIYLSIMQYKCAFYAQGLHYW